MDAAVNLIKRAVQTLSPRVPIRCEVPFRGVEKRPRILILTDRMDATYYATFHFPLRSLQEKGLLDFAAISSAEVRKGLSRTNTQRLVERLLLPKPPQVVVFSRYATPSGEDLIKAFQARGIPVFYYCDDDLLHVPASLGNGVLAAHADAEVMEQRRKCLATADRLLASTSCLAQTLTAQFPGQRTEVLLYPPYLAAFVQPSARQAARNAERGPTIGYMGSKGHQRDLEIAVPAICEMLERLPQARFETFGTIVMPSPLHRFRERVAEHGPMNSYLEFLQALDDLHWDVGLAPLIDDSFNRCRSPIKFVEYTACRIPTVASNVSVYRSAIAPGCGLLVSGHDWRPAMELLLGDGQLRQSCVDRARDDCERRFGLEDVAARLLLSLGTTHDHEDTRC